MSKYNGNPYREPSWYPENPYRLKRYEAFDRKLDGFGYHFAEVENYWDEGCKAALDTVRPLLEKACLFLGDRMLKGGELTKPESQLCGELSKILAEEKAFQ